MEVTEKILNDVFVCSCSSHSDDQYYGSSYGSAAQSSASYDDYSSYDYGKAFLCLCHYNGDFFPPTLCRLSSS